MRSPLLPKNLLSLRSVSFLLLGMLVLGVTGGCGKSAFDRQQEYRQRTTVLNDFDAQAVLAGRDPAEVLETALMNGGCVSLAKGLISASENRTVVTGAHYDTVTNQVRLEQYFEYDWGWGTIHRTTTVAYIPISGLQANIHPPTRSGEYQCWTLYLACPQKDCIRYDRHSQLIRSNSTSDKGRSVSRAICHSLYFGDRAAAIEACAALRVLAER